jgi:hypothetical protein
MQHASFETMERQRLCGDAVKFIEHRAADVATLSIYPSLPSTEVSSLGNAVLTMDADHDGFQDIVIANMGFRDKHGKVYLIDYPLLSKIFFPVFLR